MSDKALALSKTGKKIEGVHSSVGADVQTPDIMSSEALVDINESITMTDEKIEGEKGGTGSVLVSEGVKDSKKDIDETGDANQDVANVGTHALKDITESGTMADAADEKTKGTHHDAGSGHVQGSDLVTEFVDDIVEAAYATGAKNEATKIRTAAAIKMQSRFYYGALDISPF
jgi:hypothetical protein